MTSYMYSLGMQLINYYCGIDNWQIKGKIQEIAKLAKTKPEDLENALNDLCGDKGYSEVNIYEGKNQIHLYFATDSNRKFMLPILSELFAKFELTPTNFAKWQFEDKEHHFCLKLSTYQSVALLGFDPSIEIYYEKAQEILRKQVKIDRLTVLTTDILNKIFCFSNIQDVGSCASVCRKFRLLTVSMNLWCDIAQINHIPLENNMIHPKIQVIEDETKYLNAVVSLKKKRFSITGLAYATEDQIASKGGFCLVDNLDIGQYRGIAILKEKIKEGESDEHWLLHLCPGGGNCKFTTEDYDNMMPKAIKKLKELKILPEYYSDNIGRHPNKTEECFIEWQKNKKKPNSQ